MATIEIMEKQDQAVESQDLGVSPTTAMTNNSGIILIPHPSNDPRDPLNWSSRKKTLILLIICWAAFMGTMAPFSYQLTYVLMAETTYHKTPIELSYSLSACIAGFLVGPVLFTPLARVFGSCSVMFWSLLGVAACQIWAACMTGQGDYIPFVISRLIAGMFGVMPVILGPGFVMDIFFLHQRGKAFVAFEASLLLGTTFGATLSGFIVRTKGWPMTLWWTVAPLGLAIVLVFFFLEETGFHRGDDLTPNVEFPRSFIPNRVATFLPGTKVVPHISLSQLARRFIGPFVIGIAPVALISGLYAFIAFGFTIMLSILLTIYLQTPISYGGYGFSTIQNAAFTFTIWFSCLAALIVGILLSDKIPIWASHRFGAGIWHPEYRLWNMLLPSIFLPIGLGIFGASLQNHYSCIMLALGTFLVSFSSVLAVPVCLNYVVECYTTSAVEVAIAMNIYRLAFGISLPFFVQPWSKAVTAGWMFGMAAFFSLVSTGLVGVLVWKGIVLRRYNVMSNFARSEEGEKI